MSEKLIIFVWGILGALAVLGLIALGIDAVGSSRKGAAWKRGLLAAGLALLAWLGLWRFADEYFLPTCYEPPPIWWTESKNEDLVRLSSAAEQLDRALWDNALSAEVVRIRLETLRTQLDAVDNDAINGMSNADRREALRMREDIGRYLADVEERLAERAERGDTSPDWQVVITAWRTVTPLAESGVSSTPQRKEADAKLEAAKVAVDRLAKTGEITAAEAKLLLSEADRLRAEMYRNSPTGPGVVLCYAQIYIPPARESVERLAQRLPLLREIAAEHTLHPRVLERVIPSIEADLQLLSDSKQVRELPEKDRAEAVRLRDETRAALDEVKRLLAEER
jgi:hypothetical protein